MGLFRSYFKSSRKRQDFLGLLFKCNDLLKTTKNWNFMGLLLKSTRADLFTFSKLAKCKIQVWSPSKVNKRFSWNRKPPPSVPRVWPFASTRLFFERRINWTLFNAKYLSPWCILRLVISIFDWWALSAMCMNRIRAEDGIAKIGVYQKLLTFIRLKDMSI